MSLETVDRSQCQPQLLALLAEEYGLAADAIEALPPSGDAYTYRASIKSLSYFVKVLERAVNPDLEFTLALVSWLHDSCGISHVIPPVLSLRGKAAVPLAQCLVTVHPFVEGRRVATFDEAGDGAVCNLGGIVREYHDWGRGFRSSAMPVEAFNIDCLDAIASLFKTIAPGAGPSPAVTLLRTCRDGILRAADALQDLQKFAQADTGLLSVSHGDLTASNLFLGPADHLFLVDWDSASLAPIEKDLVSFAGDHFSAFWRGYVNTKDVPRVSTSRLAFFMFRWILDGIAFFGTRATSGGDSSARISGDIQTLQSFLPVDEKRLRAIIRDMEATVARSSARPA